MIYIVPHPALLDAPGSFNQVDVERLNILDRTLGILGQLAHSPLLPSERVVMLLTWELQERLRALTEIPVCPPPVRALLQSIARSRSKAAPHVLPLDRSDFLNDLRNLDVETDLGDLPSESGFDWVLAYLAHALDDCADPSGASRSVIVVAPRTHTRSVSFKLPAAEVRRVACGPDPSWLFAPHSPPRVPTEDISAWKTAVVPRRDLTRSIQNLCTRGLARELGQKGDHQHYEIAFVFIEWAKTFSAIGGTQALPAGLRRTQLFTINQDNNDYKPGHVDEKAGNLGMTSRRAWWLLHGKQEGECAPRLIDVLRRPST